MRPNQKNNHFLNTVPLVCLTFRCLPFWLVFVQIDLNQIPGALHLNPDLPRILNLRVDVAALGGGGGGGVPSPAHLC